MKWWSVVWEWDCCVWCFACVSKIKLFRWPCLWLYLAFSLLNCANSAAFSWHGFLICLVFGFFKHFVNSWEENEFLLCGTIMAKGFWSFLRSHWIFIIWLCRISGGGNKMLFFTVQSEEVDDFHFASWFQSQPLTAEADVEIWCWSSASSDSFWVRKVSWGVFGGCCCCSFLPLHPTPPSALPCVFIPSSYYTFVSLCPPLHKYFPSYFLYCFHFSYFLGLAFLYFTCFTSSFSVVWVASPLICLHHYSRSIEKRIFIWEYLSVPCQWEESKERHHHVVQPECGMFSAYPLLPDVLDAKHYGVTVYMVMWFWFNVLCWIFWEEGGGIGLFGNFFSAPR